jgi:hypothetical protein
MAHSRQRDAAAAATAVAATAAAAAGAATVVCHSNVLIKYICDRLGNPDSTTMYYALSNSMQLVLVTIQSKAACFWATLLARHGICLIGTDGHGGNIDAS